MPRARNSDPETSHEAAASVTNLTVKQGAVLEFFRRHEALTDEQLLELYREAELDGRPIPQQADSGIRTRRSELVDKGVLCHSGWTTNRAGRRVRRFMMRGPIREDQLRLIGS